MDTMQQIGRTILGSFIILVGLILALPGVIGPGLVIVLLGLVILAQDYPRARRWVNIIKAKTRRRKKPKKQ